MCYQKCNTVAEYSRQHCFEHPYPDPLVSGNFQLVCLQFSETHPVFVIYIKVHEASSIGNGHVLRMIEEMGKFVEYEPERLLSERPSFVSHQSTLFPLLSLH